MSETQTNQHRGDNKFKLVLAGPAGLCLNLLSGEPGKSKGLPEMFQEQLRYISISVHRPNLRRNYTVQEGITARYWEYWNCIG